MKLIIEKFSLTYKFEDVDYFVSGNRKNLGIRFKK